MNKIHHNIRKEKDGTNKDLTHITITVWTEWINPRNKMPCTLTRCFACNDTAVDMLINAMVKDLRERCKELVIQKKKDNEEDVYNNY